MNAFHAKYPGRCACGASFQPGARIYWNASIRRATGCPACSPRKAIPGEPRELPSGLVVRFDTHPDTGAVILCHLSSISGAWGSAEVYALVNGRWELRHVSREPVLAGVASHEQVERWRAVAA